MQQTRNAILKCLYQYSNDDEVLIAKLNKIIAEYGSGVCSAIFNVLTHLEMKPEEARTCWNEIVSHRQNMSDIFGRPVKLRTAICDYFCSVHKSLKNPVVVEIHVFEDNLNNLRYDPLTGLCSRKFYEESLDREVSRATRYGTDLSLLFLDLDSFKGINDSFGHQTGDLVLKRVAGIILDEIRTEDIAGRYGGDEIVIIMPEASKVQGLVLGERIRRKVEEISFAYKQENINITVSGGLATLPIDARDDAGLVKYADSAMYRAKAKGRNNIVAYSENKRRYGRGNFTPEIQVQVIKSGDIDTKFITNAKNISQTGLLCENNDPLDIGTIVQLRLPFVELNLTVHLIGTVIRLEPLTEGNYDIGISFLEVDDTAKNQIRKYLYGKLDS